MQAVDLKTMLAEAKRDKTVDNATISSLQQVTRCISRTTVMLSAVDIQSQHLHACT
jgi:hypothetical protein